MRTKYLLIVSFVFIFLLSACEDGENTVNVTSPIDTPPDTSADAPPDTSADAPPDIYFYINRVNNNISISSKERRNGFILKNLQDNSEKHLYKNKIVDSRIRWSHDGNVIALIITDIGARDGYIVVINKYGDELFKQEITERSFTLGWKTDQNNELLYLNSTSNVIYTHSTNNNYINNNPYDFSFNIVDGKIIIYNSNTKEVKKEITGFIYDVSMSPHNKFLLYGFNSGFCLYDFSNDSSQCVESGVDYSISPDEKNIAFTKEADDGYVILGADIYLYNIENKTEQQITHSSIFETRPSWVGDNTIAYTFYNKNDVQTISINTGN